MLDHATIYAVSKGNYKFGAIALVNSLMRLGLKNDIVIGTDINIHELEKLRNVKQVIIDSAWNATNLKAKLILKSRSPLFIYFDADIIVNDKRFITKVEEIITSGKFCVAVDGIVPQNDYRRHFWSHHIPKLADRKSTEHSWYYNAGFFAGNINHHEQLLSDWSNLIESTLDPQKFTFDDENFPMADQDIYNALLQTVPLNQLVSFSMPDWIGISAQLNPFFQIGNFRPYAFIHCTGEHKPWKIVGIPKMSPNDYDTAWYKNIFAEDNPVKTDMKLSSLQHMWFKYSLVTRIIVRLKRRFNL